MLTTLLQRACLIAALMAPALTMAEEPATDAPAPVAERVPDAKSLANVEAILEYCAKLDPASATRYLEQAKMVTQGASEETLSKVRGTNDYLQAHGELDESLAKVDARGAKKVCAQQLVQNQ